MVGGLVICEFWMWEWVFCESGVCVSESQCGPRQLPRREMHTTILTVMVTLTLILTTDSNPNCKTNTNTTTFKRKLNKLDLWYFVSQHRFHVISNCWHVSGFLALCLYLYTNQRNRSLNTNLSNLTLFLTQFWSLFTLASAIYEPWYMVRYKMCQCVTA